jgi:thioesterase domain-containing protein
MSVLSEESFIAPKDTLELELTQMWERLLDVTPVGVTDSFFDLGGHSLLAVRLLAQIQKQFGRQLTLSFFFQEPTVHRLATALRQRGASLVWSHLVPIQPRGGRRPFFCVHSLGGDVLAYYSLARRLGSEQPFYGLQAPQPSDVADQYTSIEDMASQYIEALRQIQTDGPYYLGGWSFGSVVAFEMAQQIKRCGEEVALLALFDGMSPHVTRQIDDRGDAVILAGLARDLARRSGVDLALEHELIVSLGEQEALRYILDALKKTHLLDADLGLGWIRKFLQGNRTRMNALRDYNAQVYDGRITLFRSTEVEAEGAKAWLEAGVDVRDPMRGWDKLSAKPVDLHYVPGYHATMVFEPNVRALAEQLNECLNPTAILCS